VWSKTFETIMPSGTAGPVRLSRKAFWTLAPHRDQSGEAEAPRWLRPSDSVSRMISMPKPGSTGQNRRGQGPAPVLQGLARGSEIAALATDAALLWTHRAIIGLSVRMI
jgi:hypothetical protein